MFKNWQQSFKSSAVLAALVVCSACAPLSNLPGSNSQEKLSLSIAQLEPTNRPGVYAVSGRANLPDNTLVTVTAVRQLKPAVQGTVQPEFSILSRQQVPVSQNTWKADLNVWQTGPDGKYQEAWQLTQPKAQTTVTPGPTVAFVVSLEPTNQTPALQEQLERQATTTPVQFTSEGDPYLQISRTLPVALPTGETTPPPQRSLTTHFASDRIADVTPARTQVRSPLPPGKTNVTTAPITSREFVR